MRYDAIQDVVAESYICVDDIRDLCEILELEDPIPRMKKTLCGDRLYFLRRLLKLIVFPNHELKEQAIDLLCCMNEEKIGI